MPFVEHVTFAIAYDLLDPTPHSDEPSGAEFRSPLMRRFRESFICERDGS